jgi:oxygen-independent coproporphyrinogen-3 oxidase
MAEPARHHALPREAETLESLFAVSDRDPLAHAFPGKRAVHPFLGFRPVLEAEVELLWRQLHAAPRRGRGVAYVHVPFCENHCLFCGFYQNAWRADAGPAYVDAVITQLKAFSDCPAHDGPPLQAIYIGGGTPTALGTRDLARLIAALHRFLPLTPDCEVTLEGRVISFDTDKARAALDEGVNRISLGVQSFSDRVRRPLGRRSGRPEIIAVLEGLVELDRGAVVIDLIYGLPGQQPTDIAEDVRLAASIGLDGLDLYSLNLIPGTPLLTAAEKGKLTPASTRELGRYFTAGEEAAEAEGWQPISTTHWQGTLRERNVYNFAVKTGADCLAFGASAGGFLGGVNYRITSKLDGYQARAGSGECLTQGMMRPSPAASIFNAIKAGMERGRLDPDPVEAALTTLTGWNGPSFSDHAAPLLDQWASAGLLAPYHRFRRLTRAGRFWQVTMTGRLLAWMGRHPKLENLA